MTKTLLIPATAVGDRQPAVVINFTPAQIATAAQDALLKTLAAAKGDLLAASANDVFAILTAGTNGQVLSADSAEATGLKWIASAGGGGIDGDDYICIRDEKTQNTHGGGFTSGAWRTRDLNVEQADSGNHCVITANQFVLTAGDYVILAYAPASAVDEHQAKLYNVTGTTDLIVGQTASTDSSITYDNVNAIIQGKFTIAASQSLEIQHWCKSNNAGDGFGRRANIAIEVYTTVHLWKVA